MGAGNNGKPTIARLKLWIDSVSSATLPLLAGFSTTSVVVVCQDPKAFRWPGATILALAIAAVVLIAAVQFAYHARIALSDDEYKRGLAFTKGTRWAYDIGLFFLLAGLSLAVAPPYHATGVQANLQWYASAIAFVACDLELLWTVVDPLLLPHRTALKLLSRVVDRLLRPRRTKQ